MVIVVRVDIYDFKVILNEREFASVARIVKFYGISIEHVLHKVVERGLHFELQDIFNKE